MIKDRFVALMLLAAVTTVSSYAKTRVIRGVLTDEANFPVPNALIELTCLRKAEKVTIASTKSNVDGRFQLQTTIPPGTCKIRLTAAGFSTLTVAVVDSPTSGPIDLGKILLKVSCSGPGVTCDEVTPAADPQRNDPKSFLNENPTTVVGVRP